jgi:hypothetical protein
MRQAGTGLSATMLGIVGMGLGLGLARMAPAEPADYEKRQLPIEQRAPAFRGRA